MPTYHYVQNQGKLLMQSRENGQKSQFGQFFDDFEVKYILEVVTKNIFKKWLKKTFHLLIYKKIFKTIFETILINYFHIKLNLVYSTQGKSHQQIWYDMRFLVISRRSFFDFLAFSCFLQCYISFYFTWQTLFFLMLKLCLSYKNEK